MPTGDSLGSAFRACPHLPQCGGVVTAASMRSYRSDRGPDFYRAALIYAQSLWLSGKPAQAILQLNKAWSADLEGTESVLGEFPSPYRALVWFLLQDSKGAFLGNPVRHFQHLATRMSGPRSELRAWRAWACLHLCEQVLDAESFPRDREQIVKDGLQIPRWTNVTAALSTVGWAEEARQLEELMRSLRNS